METDYYFEYSEFILWRLLLRKTASRDLAAYPGKLLSAVKLSPMAKHCFPRVEDTQSSFFPWVFLVYSYMYFESWSVITSQWRLLGGFGNGTCRGPLYQADTETKQNKKIYICFCSREQGIRVWDLPKMRYMRSSSTSAIYNTVLTVHWHLF